MKGASNSEIDIITYKSDAICNFLTYEDSIQNFILGV